MTAVLRQRYGVSCTRQQVQVLLNREDPVASQARRCNRLVSIFFSQLSCAGP